MFEKYVEYFQKNGFVVFPDIIDKERIIELRKCYKQALEKYDVLTLTPTQFLNETEIAKTIFDKKVVEILRFVNEGNYVMYPDFTIRESLYIPWHTDAAHLNPKNVTTDKKANFIQCSIYLQDNNNDTGGGLHVIPGSHLRADIDRTNPESIKKAALEEDAILMESKAGDLVLWDSRILHRSTSSKSNEQEIKLAIQWTVSRHPGYANAYLNYLKERMTSKKHVSDLNGDREVAYVNDIQNIQYPKSFKEEYLENLDQTNVMMACL